MRSGFTLSELLVALVVFAVGGLGLVAISTVVARQVADGATQTIAAVAGQTVLDSLISSTCRGAGSGSAAINGVTIDWTAADSGDAALVRETIAFPTTRGRRQSTIEAFLACE
jgi:prepilin-type N-terminal cleavage/methylation domain-containing protein